MTALSSELAGVLDEVCDAFDSHVRSVTWVHDRLHIELDHINIDVDPFMVDATIFTTIPGFFVDDDQERALHRLEIEVQNWCGEQLAQAVEDTDWTRGGTEASCG